MTKGKKNKKTQEPPKQPANINRNKAANEPSFAEVAASLQKIGKKVTLLKLSGLNKMLSV